MILFCEINVLLASFPQEQHAVSSKGSGMKRMPAGERRSMPHWSTFGLSGPHTPHSGGCGGCVHRATASHSTTQFGSYSWCISAKSLLPCKCRPWGISVCFCTTRCTFCIGVLLSSAYANSGPYPLLSHCVMQKIN